MNKAATVKIPGVDLTKFSKSTFTITFAIEITGIDVWHDCNEGWLDLGPPIQGMKIQYQIYPGQSFDLDIILWPHVAKIWCGNQYTFVRTWQFLERRWMAFSIRHAFPVRVLDLIKHIATVTLIIGLGTLGNNAKTDKNLEAYLPPLTFNERRYFGIVLEREKTTDDFIQDYIWNLVENHIPSSPLDGFFFDKPYNVTDQRQQDAVLHYVQEIILGTVEPEDKEEIVVESEEFVSSKERRDSKISKEKKKVLDVPKVKFEIFLPGNSILSGTGRIIAFETIGDRPPDLPEVIVLISSSNLPAQDDLPVIFVNVENLYNPPIQEFKNARLTQIYTRWKLFDQEHDSRRENLKTLKPVKFNDHYTLPFELEMASQLIPLFLDHPFEIQLRGVRNPKLLSSRRSFFGKEKFDKLFGFTEPLLQDVIDEYDVLIAVTKIDVSLLSKGVNGFVKGEFPLYPINQIVMKPQDRGGICTNDINAIRLPVKPILIAPHVVLQSQMTLEVSIGLLGCRPKDLDIIYSRLYCLAEDKGAIDSFLLKIIKTNEATLSKERNDILTGFALDTGSTVMFYVEGYRGGAILKIWEFTEDYYPNLKPLFSCSDKYIDRIYFDMLSSTTPFYILKMFAPLNTLLACPYMYVKPALPLPTRSALLKIGRLIANNFKIIPTLNDMPTYEELQSFKLELCVPIQPESAGGLKTNANK